MYMIYLPNKSNRSRKNKLFLKESLTKNYQKLIKKSSNKYKKQTLTIHKKI